MSLPRRIATALLLVTLPLSQQLARAEGSSLLTSLSSRETNGGIKEALSQGINRAVAELGKPQGFSGNPLVKITLSEDLQKIGNTLKKVGLGKPVDDLELRMNQAAEAAVPAAKNILAQSLKKMSVNDALGLLRGGETSITDYFRQSSGSALTEAFMPIVRSSMQKVKLAETYNRLADQAKTFGMIKPENASLEQYVTQKTLDGLFVRMAQEEKAIRQNPLQAAGSLAKKVFSSLGIKQ